jgi:hypothetical protein
MSLTIEQIEQQIADLQKTLDDLKNPKLKVSRSFTGKYFELYSGAQYRRMESEGIPIWEMFMQLKSDWIVLNDSESKKLEDVYLRDCVSGVDE